MHGSLEFNMTPCNEQRITCDYIILHHKTFFWKSNYILKISHHFFIMFVQHFVLNGLALVILWNIEFHLCIQPFKIRIKFWRFIKYWHSFKKLLYVNIFYTRPKCKPLENSITVVTWHNGNSPKLDIKMCHSFILSYDAGDL